MTGLLPKFMKQKTTSFQVVSSLLLQGDQYEHYDIPATAPYLILAGDTGRLIDFMAYLSFLKRHIVRFSRVFLILGPYELSNITPAEAAVRADQLVQADDLHDRVSLLDRARHNLSSAQITIIGCTLWPYVAPGSKRPENVGSEGTEDILDWSAELQNERQVHDFRWLRNKVKSKALDKSKGHKIVVLTAYAPTDEQIKKTAEWDGVDTWVHGLANDDEEKKVRGIRLLGFKKSEEEVAGSSKEVGRVIKI
jgi:hypothetical protein